MTSARVALLLSCVSGAAGCATSAPPATTPDAAGDQLALPCAADVRRYRIDPAASSITAIATATLGRYTFVFPDVTGHVDWVPGGVEHSRFSIEVRMASVTGSMPLATDVIRSPDFLDVERHPRARFASTGLSLEAVDRGQVRGQLELHGVSRRVQVPGWFGFVQGRLQIESEFSIDRRDYEIMNDGVLDRLVHDQVVVRLRLAAVPDEERSQVRSSGANCLNQFAGRARHYP